MDGVSDGKPFIDAKRSVRQISLDACIYGPVYQQLQHPLDSKNIGAFDVSF
jgi:hypothetical protein